MSNGNESRILPSLSRWIAARVLRDTMDCRFPPVGPFSQSRSHGKKWGWGIPIEEKLPGRELGPFDSLGILGFSVRRRKRLISQVRESEKFTFWFSRFTRCDEERAQRTICIPQTLRESPKEWVGQRWW